jgi:predicted transcriptional regulator
MGTHNLNPGSKTRTPALFMKSRTLDSRYFSAYACFMEVNLNPELQAKLAQIAAENNSGTEEYVRQLVEHYLDHDAWFRQKVKTGLGQLDRGEFVTHDEIGARIDQMVRP